MIPHRIVLFIGETSIIHNTGTNVLYSFPISSFSMKCWQQLTYDIPWSGQEMTRILINLRYRFWGWASAFKMKIHTTDNSVWSNKVGLIMTLPYISKCCAHMMTSSNGDIFRITGHLCGEFTGPLWIPHKKASDAELWCFLWSASE